MQVLGDLVKLPESDHRLPLPWWHRAPLGLQNQTWGYISLIPSITRPVGDLVISVLDPTSQKRMFSVRCRQNDAPGMVSKALEALSGTNIALAESITMESGREHEVTLICEASEEVEHKTIEARLTANNFKVDTIETFPARDVRWVEPVEILGGWIYVPKWREVLHKLCDKKPGFSRVDKTTAVVSADTRNRLLRFVFPYEGARTITIEHRDKPGVLKCLTDVLLDNDLNILSLLLRRGGAKPRNAIVVAVCEPKNGESSSNLYQNVVQQIEDLPVDMMARIKINDGLKATQTIAPREKHCVVARIPSNLLTRVTQLRNAMNEREIPVFFSHRISGNVRTDALANAVRYALRESGCQSIEVAPSENPHDQPLVHQEVVAKLWTSQAGIVLVPGASSADAIGKNLPHEFGFLQGQTKPVLFLVEAGSEDRLRGWSNMDGVLVTHFPHDDRALNHGDPESISTIIKSWVAKTLITS